MDFKNKYCTVNTNSGKNYYTKQSIRYYRKVMFAIAKCLKYQTRQVSKSIIELVCVRLGLFASS